MPDSINAPLQASVFAVDFIRVRGNEGWITLQPEFARRLAQTLGASCAVESVPSQAGNPRFSAIVLDTVSQVLSPLRRLLGLQEETTTEFPECRLRFYVHHGVIFSSGETYLGSALRVAHRRLEQLPDACYCAASPEFAAHTQSWGSQSLDFGPLPGDSTGTLLAISFAQATLTPQPGGASGALVEQLTRLLANRLGPFAEILVETASRTCRNPRQLVEEVAREIDRPEEREEFRREALNLIESSDHD